MNSVDRIKMVKAMEYVVRHINDEEIFMSWLSVGVADQDIKYGDLDPENDKDTVDYYIEDDNFKDLMSSFLRLMELAKKDGGLVCDNICC